MKIKQKELLPDFLSVSKSTEEEKIFSISDGTYSVEINELNIGFSCNFIKPFELRTKDGRWLLTHKQLEILFTEFLRFTKFDEP